MNVKIYGFVIFEGLFETLIHPTAMKFDLKSGEIIYLGLSPLPVTVANEGL